jgi:hypothetical protein
MRLSIKCPSLAQSNSPKQSRADSHRLSTLLALSLIFILGCPKNEKNVSDLLTAANKRHAVVIEQIGLNIREGVPNPEDVANAKVIKRVDQSEQIGRLASVLSKATPGRSFANHPISIGNCVLRIIIDGQPYLLYCEMLESKDGKYCVFSVGGANEIDINRMAQFESKLLVDWLRDNGIEVK